MNGKELLKVINDAIKKGTTKLDLPFFNLAQLPPEIGNFASLTALNLYKNQLTQLPSEIGNLTNLTTLNLTNNHLTHKSSYIKESKHCGTR